MALSQIKGSVQIAFAPSDVKEHDHHKFTLHLTMSFGEDTMSARDKPTRLVGVKNQTDKQTATMPGPECVVKMLYEL